MNAVALEWKKRKRTGLLTAYLGGGMLAGTLPVAQMFLRPERFLGQPGGPVQILLGENGQMMAMLNVLLTVAGTCLQYHLEYADNAMGKMRALPIPESALFLGKGLLASLLTLVTLIIEAGVTGFCAFHWFGTGKDVLGELLKNFGFLYALTLPCIFLSLLIGEAFPNMWTALGIGVICVFVATMIPAGHFALSLFPYALPFRLLGEDARRYLLGAACELGIIGLMQWLYRKGRRMLA